METPNYVLKTNEAVLMPVNQNKWLSVLRPALLVIIGILIVGSFVFGDNLFGELTWSTRIILILLAGFAFLFSGKEENVPSPIELQFYDDYLILFRPKCYYNKKVTRMEINKMYYSEIKKCAYISNLQRVHIYGDLHAKWYNYDGNGNISSKPSYDRFVKDTMCYFRTRLAPDVDFIKEIEEHSPIKVVTETR